jgi:hypothetical protein
MAIQVLYPSRRQSRWTNPLFLCQRLRIARRAAAAAAIFALAVYGVGHLERAEQTSTQQSREIAVDAALRLFDPHADPAQVRVVPAIFNPQGPANTAG